MKANCKRSLPRCSTVCPVWRALAPACPVRAAAGRRRRRRRGAGESKLEYDRRHVRRRIDALRERLEELERRRAETRKSREKSGVPVVALVGYTNVGKSSLLNRLCGAQVLEADMLFATLDPTARRLSLPSGLACVAVDTVGFVSRLPHNLVQAFKSTLEEAAFADVILKVCDASDPEAAAQLAVTDDVLGELGCGDIPQIVVYNKCDRVENAALFDTSAVRTSAVTGEGLDALLARLDAALAGRVRRIAVLLPMINWERLRHAGEWHCPDRGVPSRRRVSGRHCQNDGSAPFYTVSGLRRIKRPAPPERGAGRNFYIQSKKRCLAAALFA